MKIILDNEERDRVHKVEIVTDAFEITDVLIQIERALVAYGFEAETVRDGVMARAEEINLTYPNESEEEKNED